MKSNLLELWEAAYLANLCEQDLLELERKGAFPARLLPHRTTILE